MRTRATAGQAGSGDERESGGRQEREKRRQEARAGLAGVGSGRQEDQEWARDEAVLWWVVRFRFVTIGALALRWDVTEQRMRARVRRLEREGMLQRERRSSKTPAAIVPTNQALVRLGLPVRRTPHFDGRLGHEVAIIKRVTAAEAYFRANRAPDTSVLTEREMLAWTPSALSAQAAGIS